jgi:hypothetical protein
MLVCLFGVLPLQYLFVARGEYAFYALFIPAFIVVALSGFALAGRSRDERNGTLIVRGSSGTRDRGVVHLVRAGAAHAGHRRV